MEFIRRGFTAAVIMLCMCYGIVAQEIQSKSESTAVEQQHCKQDKLQTGIPVITNTHSRNHISAIYKITHRETKEHKPGWSEGRVLSVSEKGMSTERTAIIDKLNDLERRQCCSQEVQRLKLQILDLEY